MPAISVDELAVQYGDLRAVDGVTFAVEPGEVVALLGPNGAGKTTTVETAEGYRRPHGGAVRVLGLDPVADHETVTQRIGVMLQNGGVYPGIRPLEVLRLFAAYYPDAEDPAALLDRVGLTSRAGATWRQLSGGEQQRLSFALAVIGKPQVLFLDEPTAGVDVGGRQSVRELIREQRATGTAVLLTTHELDEAERIADRIVIIDHGRIVASGTPTELARAAGDEIRFGALPGLDVESLSQHVGATVVEATPGEYVVAAAPAPATVAAITAWLADRDLPLADLRAGRQRLEDVFLRLTGTEDTQ